MPLLETSERLERDKRETRQIHDRDKIETRFQDRGKRDMKLWLMA